MGAAVATLVLLALQFMRLSSVMIKHDLELVSILRMLGGLAMSFSPLVFPIAFLFASLGVFGRMSTDREFIAMQAMGYSPMRVLIPCGAFGVLMTALSLWLSFSIGPLGNRSFEASMDEAFKRRVSSVLRSGTFSEGFLDMVVFVDRVDPVTMQLERIFIFDDSNFKAPAIISARNGRWIQSLSDGVGILDLIDGVIVSELPEKGVVRRISFDEYRLNADFTRAVGWSRDSPPSLGWDGLMKKRAEAQKDLTINARPIWIETSRRFAMSILCLLLVPLCFAASVDNRRTAKGRAVFIGLSIILSYWTLYFALLSWVMGTPIEFFIRKEWAVYMVIWLPNFIVMGLGYWLFKKRFTYGKKSAA